MLTYASGAECQATGPESARLTPNPGTSGVDAFVQNWSGENCLLIPPVVLIHSVLDHIHMCRAKGTLI